MKGLLIGLSNSDLKVSNAQVTKTLTEERIPTKSFLSKVKCNTERLDPILQSTV